MISLQPLKNAVLDRVTWVTKRFEVFWSVISAITVAMMDEQTLVRPATRAVTAQVESDSPVVVTADAAFPKRMIRPTLHNRIIMAPFRAVLCSLRAAGFDSKLAGATLTGLEYTKGFVMRNVTFLEPSTFAAHFGTVPQ